MADAQEHIDKMMDELFLALGDGLGLDEGCVLKALQELSLLSYNQGRQRGLEEASEQIGLLIASADSVPTYTNHHYAHIVARIGALLDAQVAIGSRLHLEEDNDGNG